MRRDGGVAGPLAEEPVAPPLFVFGQVVVAGRGVPPATIRTPAARAPRPRATGAAARATAGRPARPPAPVPPDSRATTSTRSGGDSRRTGRQPSFRPARSGSPRGAAKGSRSSTARSGSQLWRGTGQATLPNPKRFPSRSRRAASSSRPPVPPFSPRSNRHGSPLLLRPARTSPPAPLPRLRPLRRTAPSPRCRNPGRSAPVSPKTGS